MKKNMKGFTLIELLAVIVILGIIMVVAVPQILNVIADSRKSAWDSNIKLIKESIELKSSIDLMNSSTNWLTTNCSSINTKIKDIADISSNDTTLSCTGNGPYTITISAVSTGKFKGQTAHTLTCTAAGSCTQTS